MDTRTMSISARPWRVEEVSALGFGDSTSIFQPGRLDVFVHLLAFEQLAESVAGPEQPSRVLAEVDWLARSDTFAVLDNERGVVEVAAELVGSPSVGLPVSFASGGQLVRGAVAAAGARYAERDIDRMETADKAIDRSYAGLLSEGWTSAELRMLLLTWSRMDPAAAIVMIDLDAPGAEAAEYEISCRYPVMATSVEHLSEDDARVLGCSRPGSIRLLYISASGPTFAQVLDRQREAVVFARRGPSVRAALVNLWSTSRAPSTSRSHEQRVRRLRRRERMDQLFRRVLGR